MMEYYSALKKSNHSWKDMGGTSNANYYVKEDNPERLHTVKLQLNILEKASLWRQ